MALTVCGRFFCCGFKLHPPPTHLSHSLPCAGFIGREDHISVSAGNTCAQDIFGVWRPQHFRSKMICFGFRKEIIWAGSSCIILTHSPLISAFPHFGVKVHKKLQKKKAGWLRVYFDWIWLLEGQFEVGVFGHTLIEPSLLVKIKSLKYMLMVVALLFINRDTIPYY